MQHIANQEGEIIRSNAIWIEGEKKEEKRLSLEKKNYPNKIITSVNVNGKIISNPKEILTAEHDYFLDLYTDRTDSSDESYIDSLNSFIHQPNS